MDDDRRIYGIDFAAAARDAGEKVWIAECEPDADGGLRVLELEPAIDRFEKDPKTREDTYGALVEFVTEQKGGATRPAAFGFDVPFGIGPELVPNETEWSDLVADFPNVALSAYDEEGDGRGPVRFYEAVKGDHGTSASRRPTDAVDALAPADWRMKELTYHGIREVISKLVATDGVTVAPMQGKEGDRVVVETYPSRVFENLDGATKDGYKGVRGKQLEQRAENVEALETAETAVHFDGEHTKTKACASDDALDAVAAAYGTFCAAKEGFEPDTDVDTAFGYIYA